MGADGFGILIFMVNNPPLIIGGILIPHRHQKASQTNFTYISATVIQHFINYKHNSFTNYGKLGNHTRPQK